MKLFLRLIGAALLVSLCFSTANASPEIRKAANLMVLAEALLAEISLVSELTGEEVDAVEWYANFSETHWTVTLSGDVADSRSNITLSGFVWGEDEQDLQISFSGGGGIGGQPTLIHGRAILPYNSETNDYDQIDFQLVTRFGEGSFWGWVLGAEIFVGGSVGGIVAVGGASTATGGLALGAAPWIAAGGAAGGAATLVTISTGAKSLLETHQPPDAPAAPTLPAVPQGDEPLPTEKGNIVISITSEKRISGTAIDGIHALDGSYFWDDNSAYGKIYAQ